MIFAGNIIFISILVVGIATWPILMSFRRFNNFKFQETSSVAVPVNKDVLSIGLTFMLYYFDNKFQTQVILGTSNSKILNMYEKRFHDQLNHY
jgi:hypothetical protein